MCNLLYAGNVDTCQDARPSPPPLLPPPFFATGHGRHPCSGEKRDSITPCHGCMSCHACMTCHACKVCHACYAMGSHRIFLVTPCMSWLAMHACLAKHSKYTWHGMHACMHGCMHSISGVELGEAAPSRFLQLMIQSLANIPGTFPNDSNHKCLAGMGLMRRPCNAQIVIGREVKKFDGTPPGSNFSIDNWVFRGNSAT